MKKTIFKTLWALLVVATIAPLASCSSDDDEGVKSFKVNVTIGLPEGVAADNVEGLQLIATKGTVSDTVNIANPAATEITLPQGPAKSRMRQLPTSQERLRPTSTARKL